MDMDMDMTVYYELKKDCGVVPPYIKGDNYMRKGKIYKKGEIFDVRENHELARTISISKSSNKEDIITMSNESFDDYFKIVDYKYSDDSLCSRRSCKLRHRTTCVCNLHWKRVN